MGTATYNIADAKAHLSKIIERVRGGEEIIIAKSGRPVAKLVSIQQAHAREPGGWEGLVRIAPDFDDPLPEDIQAAFEGRAR